MKEAGVEFLKSILETNMGLNDIVHESASFLAGLAGIIMAITLTQTFASTGIHRIGFIVISLTCFLVVFFSIGVVRPKIGQNKLNLMYYKGILKLSRKEYSKSIGITTKDEKKIVDEFCEEIYDLSLELKQKFKMIKRGADVLAVGVLAGIVLVFI